MHKLTRLMQHLCLLIMKTVGAFVHAYNDMLNEWNYDMHGHKRNCGSQQFESFLNFKLLC